MVATVATVAVVGVAAAAFEVALLPGIILGVAAVAVPRYFPKIGAALNPLFRSTVRGAYQLGHKTREMMAEAQEQFHDIAAEVHAEKDVEPVVPKIPRQLERRTCDVLALSSATQSTRRDVACGFA